MSASDLNVMQKKIIVGLEDTGFKDIAVVTNNNSINGKAVSYFLSPPKLLMVYPITMAYTMA